MIKKFNTIVDINNKTKIYPVNLNDIALFITEDNRFFIYAFYTKTDLTKPNLIEITYDKYIEFRKILPTDSIQILCNNLDELKALLNTVKINVNLESLTIGQLLQLPRNEGK